MTGEAPPGPTGVQRLWAGRVADALREMAGVAIGPTRHTLYDPALETVRAVHAEGIELENGTGWNSVLTAVVGPLRGVALALPAPIMDEHDFVRVGSTLQSASQPDLFAVGDALRFPAGSELPKSWMLTRRQAPLVAQNLLAHAAGHELRPFDTARAQGRWDGRPGLWGANGGGQGWPRAGQRSLAPARACAGGSPCPEGTRVTTPHGASRGLLGLLRPGIVAPIPTVRLPAAEYSARR